LTIALAEYEAVREMRRGAHEGSAARFNYFLVVASGGTAVVAGLLGSAGALSTGRTAAAFAVGAIVLLVGGIVFVRLVHYRVTGLEYNTALDALRTYLVARAPELRPYVLLPTLEKDIRLRMGSRVRSWTGLAQTVALVNSVLVATATAALVAWGTGTVWAAAGCGLLMLAGAVAVQRVYERVVVRRAIARLHEHLDPMARRRALDADHLASTS
jgi:hypothetical protein